MNGSQLYEQNTQQEELKPGTFRPRRSLSQLTKTFEVETSRVFTLPVAYFARVIDFHSYVDTTMSLYSINNYYI